MIFGALRELEAIFAWILAASWQASVLALLVLLLQKTLGARLNPRWRYALWLLVLVRLVLPALPESALSLFQFAPLPPPSLVEPVTEPLFVSTPFPVTYVEAPAISPAYPFSFYTLLALIWLGGAVLLLALTWQVNRRFARQIGNSPAITDRELLRQFAAAKNELSIRRAIRLVENSHVQSPAIMGLFHPTLLLPANARDKFDDRELRFIFLHELAHLRRGDVIAQALIAVLQIVHWFNPILWFAFRRMRIDREPATDALVLSRTGEDEKERYGLMLIKLLQHFNQRHSLPTLVGILEDKDQFKRRFSLIAKFTRGAYGWSLLGILLIGVLSVACLTAKKSEPQNVSSGKLEKNPPPPIYVWFHEIADGFMGPVGHEYSISPPNNPPIPGTNHTLSVFCNSFTKTQATLVFIETWPIGPTRTANGQTGQPMGENRKAVQIPLGEVYTFRIFNSVDITTSPTLESASASTGNVPAAKKDDVVTATSSVSMSEAKQKGIAALVNGKPIYWADIIYDRSPSGDASTPKQDARELGGWAQDAIETELIVQANDTSKDPFVPNVQQVIDFGVKGFGGDKNAFAENLKNNGTTLERFTETTRKQAIVNHVLTDFYKEHKNSTSTSSLTEEDKKRELANGYTDLMRQKDEWVKGLRSKAQIQLFGAVPLPPQNNTPATASTSAKAFVEVYFINTAQPWPTRGDGPVANETADELLKNPANTITRTVISPLVSGTNTVPLKTALGSDYTVIVDCKDPLMMKDRLLTVKWTEGDVSSTSGKWSFENGNECYLLKGPTELNSSVLVRFSPPVDENAPKTIAVQGEGAAATSTQQHLSGLAPSLNTPPDEMVQLTTKVIEIGEDDYEAHRAEIDAAVKSGDFEPLSHFKSYSLIASPSGLFFPNQQGVLENIRLFTFPSAFGKDSSGKIVATDFKQIKIGSRFVFTPKVTNGKIDISGHLTVTNLLGWADTDKQTPHAKFDTFATSMLVTFSSTITMGFNVSNAPQPDPALAGSEDGSPQKEAPMRRFLFLTATQAAPTPASSAGPATTLTTRKPQVVAVVNGHTITQEDMKRSLAPEATANLSSNEQKQLNEKRKIVLRALIMRLLFIDDFKSQGKSIPASYVDEQIDDIIKKEYGGDRTAFLATVKARGGTLESYQKEIEETAMISEMGKSGGADIYLLSLRAKATIEILDPNLDKDLWAK